MLSKRQYQILNSCADDWELFYFPFAMVNYGGSVSRRTDPSVLIAETLGLKVNPARYEDQGIWHVSASGRDIADDIHILFMLGLLDAQRICADGERESVRPTELSKEELKVYHDYRCLTFQDHFETFGEGPHEFMVSKLGLEEIERSIYREYDKELGWPIS